MWVQTLEYAYKKPEQWHTSVLSALLWRDGKQGQELAIDFRASNQWCESNFSWVWGDYLFGSGFFLAREWLWLPRLNSKSSSSEYVCNTLEIIFKSSSPIQIGWSWKDGARGKVTEEQERNLNSPTQLGQCFSWTKRRQSSRSSSPKLPIFLLSFVYFL